MGIIDISNPFTLLLILVLLIGTILLGKTTKNSLLPAGALAIFLGLLIYYVVALRNPELADIRNTILNCMSINFIFIFIAFISYLWVDDIEAKVKNRKSIDNSLDWKRKKTN